MPFSTFDLFFICIRPFFAFVLLLHENLLREALLQQDQGNHHTSATYDFEYFDLTSCRDYVAYGPISTNQWRIANTSAQIITGCYVCYNLFYKSMQYKIGHRREGRVKSNANGRCGVKMVSYIHQLSSNLHSLQ